MTLQERQVYKARVAARKAYYHSMRDTVVCSSTRTGFNYPVHFEGEVATITVHKAFPKRELAGRDYDVIVDMNVYNRLKRENRRLFVQAYIGGKWHRHDNVVRIVLQLNEFAQDKRWSLSWYVLGKRPPKGVMADHINGHDLDNRRENLRWVTHEQNMQNRPGWNRYSSHPGISFRENSGRWDVCIHRSFKSLEEAEAFSEAVHGSVFGQYARDPSSSADLVTQQASATHPPSSTSSK